MAEITTQQSGLKTKRAYGKINEAILIEGIARGMTLGEAGKLAGSKEKSIEGISQNISRRIHNNTPLKRSIIEKLEALQHQILDSIKPNEVFKTPFTQRMVAFGITTDKAQLLKGDPTSRVEIMPKMVLKEDEVSFETAGELKRLEDIQKLPIPSQETHI